MISHRLPRLMLLAALVSTQMGIELGFCSESSAQDAAPSPSPAESVPALHETIDQLVGQAAGRDEWPLASDPVFMRRVFLDLVGTLPSSTEVREFLTDTNPDKRTALIDRLLADPRHASHMANWMDLTLLERRPKVHIDLKAWEQFLTASFAANKPLNVLAQEILAADGTNEEQRAAARFYLARNVEANVLTRDIGRVFFGRDFQCAQCHNHPHIEDYNQADYYGIFAFVNRSFLFTDKEQKTFVADKADGDVEFTSVFTGDSGQTGPRLPLGERLIEPVIAPDRLYQTAPADGVRPVPTFSRRQWLAEQVATGNNQAFNRNWANRLWAIMFGQGLVHPLDLHHADNPPTHPQLMHELAKSLAEMDFDSRRFLREIAISRTYQRAFESEPLETVSQEELDSLRTRIQSLSEKRDAITSELQSQSADKLEILTASSQARIALDTAIDQWQAGEKQLAIHLANQRTWSASLSQKQEHIAALQLRSNHLKAALEQLGIAQQQLALTEAQSPNAVFTARTEAVQAEIEKALGEQQKLQQDLEGLPAVITQAQQQLDSLAAAKRQLEPAHQATFEAWQKKRSAIEQLEMQQTRCNHAIELLTTEQLTLEARLKRSQQRQQLAVVSQELATANTRLQETTARLAETESAWQAAENELKSLAQVTASQQTELTRLTSLSATFVSLDEQLTTAQQLLGDEQLTAIAQSARQRAESARSSSEALQQEQAQTAARLKAMQERQLELRTMVDSLAGTAAELKTQVSAQTTAQATLANEVQRLELELAEQENQWLDLAETRLISANLKPLSPEQMAWSLMQVTGVVDNQIASRLAELEKESPLSEEQRADPAFVAARRDEAEKIARENLLGNVNVFVSLFGHGSGQPQDGFFATVDQSLFFANAGTVQGWIGQGGQSLYQRLLKLEDMSAFAEELYLTVYCRPPSDQEVAMVADYMSSAGDDRAVATRELIWALVTSSEFRFNH